MMRHVWSWVLLLLRIRWRFWSWWIFSFFLCLLNILREIRRKALDNHSSSNGWTAHFSITMLLTVDNYSWRVLLRGQPALFHSFIMPQFMHSMFGHLRVLTRFCFVLTWTLGNLYALITCFLTQSFQSYLFKKWLMIKYRLSWTVLALWSSWIRGFYLRLTVYFILNHVCIWSWVIFWSHLPWRRCLILLWAFHRILFIKFIFLDGRHDVSRRKWSSFGPTLVANGILLGYMWINTALRAAYGGFLLCIRFLLDMLIHLLLHLLMIPPTLNSHELLIHSVIIHSNILDAGHGRRSISESPILFVCFLSNGWMSSVYGSTLAVFFDLAMANLIIIWILRSTVVPLSSLILLLLLSNAIICNLIPSPFRFTDDASDA